MSATTRAILWAMLYVASAAVGAGPPDQGSTAVQSGQAIQEQTPVRIDERSGRTNRLGKATSPYLLQHARNPVEWFEWGAEAFEKAKNEDKPIFLSIGYSTCHWCHVMAHESFESQDVADELHAGFVSIKVDREERPDIDELYMAYTQARTGGGGWPMSVWLTPDGTPFHAGTYFPREQFLNLLSAITETWKNDRPSIVQGARGAKSFFDRWAAVAPPTQGVPPRNLVDSTARKLSGYFDRAKGGMKSSANKFPPSMAMDLLLRVHRRTGDAELLEAVAITLDHMARGGIYDHIGGGICRYSTDPEWLAPHFEKMLYDQAMVSSIYLDAFQVTKNPLYAYTARDIFDYVLTDLTSREGGFFSARDADSEGMEGKYYLWRIEEVRECLGEDDAKLFCAYYDVSDSGNWFERFGHAPPGPKNILHVSKPPEMFAKAHSLDVDEFTKRRLPMWREKMRAARSKRVPPHLDDKVLTEWNGLMIAGLAKGARVLDEPKYADAAARAARFILENMRRDGRLLHSYRDGRAKLTAYLSDYAFLIEGLLNLYEATFDGRWLEEAASLADTSVKYYYDDRGGAFFFTASDAEELLARSKHPHDGAIPAANSVQAMNLLRLAVLLDRKDYREKAESIFRAFGAQIEESPGAFERLLCALDFYHDKVKEVAIVGDLQSSPTKALIRTVYERYLPNKVVVGASDGADDTRIALLKGKTRQKGRATAYVCENYRCRLPVATAEELTKELSTP